MSSNDEIAKIERFVLLRITTSATVEMPTEW